MIRTEVGHLQVFECEDHRLGEKHSARLFIDGGGDYMGVDRQALLILARPVHIHFHRGVLGGQEGSQVLIENENHLDLSCTQRETNTKEKPMLQYIGKRGTDRRKRGCNMVMVARLSETESSRTTG